MQESRNIPLTTNLISLLILKLLKLSTKAGKTEEINKKN